MSVKFFDAIRAGNKEAVERFLLLDSGLIHAAEKGLSPVLVAAYHLEPHLAEYLADKKVTLDIFEASAIGRTTHIIRILARQPELVNVFADDGFQPLGLACFFGHLEAADYLVKAGASVNTPSNNPIGATPLQSAVAGNHVSIVKALLKNGAHPNVHEGAGFTPLHTAARNGNAEIVQLLILSGADLHAQTGDGKIALDLAREKGQSQAVEILKREITKRFRRP
ncbi:MAG: hypothetical protein HFACDABA_00600 [Anaerolineales bacterium]|nr:hypothetical protein [Anaerolineales bacterium]